MNHRLVVPSALSLSALAVICGVVVPSQTSGAVARTEPASHPVDARNLFDTGPVHGSVRSLVVPAAPDPFAAWRAGELPELRQAAARNSRASSSGRRALSPPRATPVQPVPRPAPSVRRKPTVSAKTGVKPSTRKQTRAETAVRTALAQRGKPYVWGATGPGAFDCSGLVQYAYRRAGIRLPRVTWDQLRAGRRVPLAAVRSGDLVFFRDASHVGMYIGGGRIVHAPKPGTRIRTADLHLMRVYAVVRPY